MFNVNNSLVAYVIENIEEETKITAVKEDAKLAKKHKEIDDAGDLATRRQCYNEVQDTLLLRKYLG